VFFQSFVLSMSRKKNWVAYSTQQMEVDGNKTTFGHVRCLAAELLSQKESQFKRDKSGNSELLAKRILL